MIAYKYAYISMIAYKYAYISMIAYKITHKMWVTDETSEERISFHLSKK